MSWLKNIFESTSTDAKETTVDWNRLEALSDIETLLEASKTMPQVVFKHSTRCGISRAVLRNFENDFKEANTLAALHYLDVLNHRDISNKLAEKFQVEHESPQLLVIKEGKVVHHASHSVINAQKLASL